MNDYTKNTDHKKHILLIEDDTFDAKLVMRHLEREHPDCYDITHIVSVEALADMNEEQQFDVALLDMHLPGLSGVDAVDYVQRFDSKLAIIILTGEDDKKTAKEAARHGAQDYIVKGNSNGDIIHRSIGYSIDRKQYQNSIMYLQQCDRLTGLFSREVFQTLLSGALVKALGNQSSLAVFHINLDHFKKINEFYGEDVGNIVINEVASRLSQNLQKTHLVARIDSDQFLFAYEGLGEMDAYASLAQKILEVINEPFKLGELDIQITASVGVAFSEKGEDSTPALLKRAERALRNTKKAGRNGYQFYSQHMDALTEEKLFINVELPKAIKNNEFFLCYQPQVSLQTGAVVGVEALLRWVHPEKGFIPPDKFIPIAEKSGMIHEISVWVLNEVKKQALLFAEKNIEVAVNISAAELSQDGVVSWLQNVSDAFQETKCQLVLELTETAVMNDVDRSLSVMHAIKDMGIKLHVDDFGTGYSSLSYLRKLPVDTLKIDRSFVMDMTKDNEDMKIVELIISLAHALDITVVAEGVEDDNVEKQLQLLGCDIAQGYYYAKPMVIDELKTWIKEKAASLEVA